jgi:regulator of sigma E protease
LFNASSLAAVPELALILGIMVVIHELGHFIAAKLCGVRVEAFAIGFGKRLFGIVHNGTDYCINLIPLGGYVKMAGELPGETGSDDPAEFQNHPRWQRTIIAFAGPVANFILAFILITGLYMTHKEVPAYITQTAVADYITPNSPLSRTGIRPGDRIVHFDTIENPTWIDLEQRSGLNFNQNTPFAFMHDGRRVETRLLVENANKAHPEDFDFEQLGIVPVAQTAPMRVATLTAPNLPAAQAGLLPGDTIVAFDDQHLHSVIALLAYLRDLSGKTTVLTVERQTASGIKTLPISITPVNMDTQRGKAWILGFGAVPPPANIERLSLAQAIPASWDLNLKNSRLIFDVLRRLFTRQVSVKSLSSPIGIGVQVHDAFQAKGWMPIIETTAMISLNLGIFNLLPIPILDGGMILFLFIEALMRRDLNQAVKERVYQVAFVCLILFAAVVIFNDITKYLPTHLKT